MRAMKAGSLGLVLCLAAGAHAQDRAPHRLMMNVADNANWEVSVSNRLSETPANEMMSDGEIKQSFRYQIKTKGSAFVVTRRELSYQDDRKPGALMAGVSDLAAGELDAFKDIVFRADASLMPQEVVNLSAIRAKQRDYATRTFGKEMARMMGQDQVTSASIISDSLSLEALTARVRQKELVIGVPLTEPDAIPSMANGPDVKAHTTVTLDSWDTASGIATYTVTTQIDEDAKTADLTAFFENLLYPLNTMDDNQIAVWKKKSAELAEAADYSAGWTCTLHGDIHTGLIADGHCLIGSRLKSEVVSHAIERDVHFEQAPEAR